MPLADFLENRELELLYRWIEAFADESPRYNRVVHSVAPEIFVVVFKQILTLLKGGEDTEPIGPTEFYVKGSDRKHISDLLQLLVVGERILRTEIIQERKAISCAQAAAEMEQLNAAVHRLLYLHVGEFCSECEDRLLDYCREIRERAAGSEPEPRGIKPLQDPLERRMLAFLPPLHRHSTVQDTLTAFMRSERSEILARWVSLLDEHEGAILRARVESVDTTLSELLDEVMACVGCCTLRPPHLRNTPAPCDGAPNALHIILVGEEAIAGVLRSAFPEIDDYWLGLRCYLNDGFHQLLRKNVASECGRCKSLISASRHRLRSLENRMATAAQKTSNQP